MRISDWSSDVCSADLKQEVRVLEEQVADTRRTILEDQEAVHVLEAEWSYLNSPARIGALAERQLDLAPIPAERIIAFRSAERRVGTAWVSACKSRWSPYQKKKNRTTKLL